MINIVLGQKYYLGFCKVQIFAHFFRYFLGRYFFVVEDIDIARYPDDTTPFIVEENIENVIASLEEDSNTLFDWFRNNRLKSSADKCHAFVSTNKPADNEIDDYTIDTSKCEKTVSCKT